MITSKNSYLNFLKTNVNFQGSHVKQEAKPFSSCTLPSLPAAFVSYWLFFTESYSRKERLKWPLEGVNGFKSRFDSNSCESDPLNVVSPPRVQREQLEAIFQLLKDNKATFGDVSEGDMEEQLRLYSIWDSGRLHSVLRRTSKYSQLNSHTVKDYEGIVRFCIVI